MKWIVEEDLKNVGATTRGTDGLTGIESEDRCEWREKLLFAFVWGAFGDFLLISGEDLEDEDAFNLVDTFHWKYQNKFMSNLLTHASATCSKFQNKYNLQTYIV